MSIWEILNKICSMTEHAAEGDDGGSDLIIDDDGNVVVNFSHVKVREAVANHMIALSRICS